MTVEFACPECGLINERWFTKLSSAEGVEITPCECGAVAARITSTPLAIHLYGNPEGYSKPSALKRWSTKLVNKNGNT